MARSSLYLILYKGVIVITGRIQSLSSSIFVKQHIQPWQLAVSVVVCSYLAIGAATHSVRTYHWFMLIAIPGALLAAERGRQFFLDWAPLFAFWLTYDRLRLLQPSLLNRVTVEYPYQIEQWAFGWLAGGDVPAHEARAWLASQAAPRISQIVMWLAQAVYFSHLFLVPILFVWLWTRGRQSKEAHSQFTHYMRAFAYLNFLAILVYLLLPVAPPWWISAHGFAQPTIELVSQTTMAAGMDGTLVQGMIKTAPQWFAAVPSLHGAYPVLLLLLCLSSRSRLKILAIATYGMSMWAATVVLNQHYIIDLIAGALLAILASRLAAHSKSKVYAAAVSPPEESPVG